jgi:signal transduction histidine kinase
MPTGRSDAYRGRMGCGIAPCDDDPARRRREAWWRHALVDSARVSALAGFQLVGTWVAAHHQLSARPLGFGGTALLIAGPLSLPLRPRAPWFTLGVTLVAAFAYFSIGFPRGPIFASVVVALLGIFRERRAQDRRRRDNERLRLARELHDVLAHSTAVVSVQAGVALHLMDTHPEQVRRSLEAIRDASADSLRELRAAVDLLRTDTSARAGSAAASGPGLATLNTLLASAGSAGVAVRSVIEGAPRPLRPELDLAAYRIIQESLTNAARHAGPGLVRLHLRYDHDVLVLRIDSHGRAGAMRDRPATDRRPPATGRPAATGPAATDGPAVTISPAALAPTDALSATPAKPSDREDQTGLEDEKERSDRKERTDRHGPEDQEDRERREDREGRGLVGMRERASALGGSVRAGPTLDGGFQVLARLPYGSGG